MKPFRRPIRAISNDAGIVATAEPSTYERHAERGELLGVGERIADEPVHRDEPRAIGEQERLTTGEQKDIAVRCAHCPTITNRMPPLAREILDFWFGPPPHAPRAEWFRKDAAFDATIAERFGGAIESAIGGGFREWCSDTQGALARVLLLDQFTRNAYRGNARAFAGDAEGAGHRDRHRRRGPRSHARPLRARALSTCRSSIRKTG